MNLGLALMQEGRFSEAEPQLLEALKLQPTPSPNLPLNVGSLYYEEGRFEESVNYFEQSMQAGTPSAVEYRGSISRKKRGDKMDRPVTLTYAPNGDFLADPFQCPVAPGDTINFQLASGSQIGTIRIAFHDRHFFSSPKAHFAQDGVFRQGDGALHVVYPLSGPTAYDCELLGADDQVIARHQGPAGGECIPASS
jgi:tetratricopeptide (TPR) repeat protein